MKVNQITVELDLKQMLNAFIDCYEVLDFLADREQSDNECNVEMVQRVKAKSAALSAAAIESVSDKPNESIFVLALTACNIALNTSNIMFQADASMAMEEDE